MKSLLSFYVLQPVLCIGCGLIGSYLILPVLLEPEHRHYDSLRAVALFVGVAIGAAIHRPIQAMVDRPRRRG